MSSNASHNVLPSQVPPPGSLNLDHVASFVPDRERCRAALAALGFAPAPFSLQYHRLVADGELVPAGSGNHCVMLREGYLEYLVPVSDTPVAAQLRAAIDRYVGAHSIVFGTADAHADHRRLEAEGFEPGAPIALQRDLDVDDATRTARFTVVRVAPGQMAEGRIQFCQHHTPQWVWQSRWLDHPNGAVALRAVIVCVPDATAAVRRYSRFTGIEPMRSDDAWVIPLQRGRVVFVEPRALAGVYGIASPPAVPWIAGCEVASSDLRAAQALWSRNGIACAPLAGGRVLVRAPDGIGGVFVFGDA